MMKLYLLIGRDQPDLARVVTNLDRAHLFLRPGDTLIEVEGTVIAERPPEPPRWAIPELATNISEGALDLDRAFPPRRVAAVDFELPPGAVLRLADGTIIAKGAEPTPPPTSPPPPG